MPAKDKAQEKAAEKKPAEKAAKKPAKEEYNPWKVLHYPHLAEKSMNMVELENKLVFMVNRRATRAQIKEAVEKGFKVKVLSVNMVITQKGIKKAYIKLSPEHLASDIASRMGMI
jgi:large subunit ribosomal protein L23